MSVFLLIDGKRMQFGGAVMLCAALAGCASPKGRMVAPSLAERHARTATTFEFATLSKPDTDTVIAEALTLAPIVIDQTTSNKEVVQVQPATVYAGKMSADIAGASHEQWVYWWWYPPVKGEREDRPRWCWLRMTLDGAGYPVIWETLTSASRVAEVYVARNLEDRAGDGISDAHMRPAYAVERGASPDSPLWVMRVIEDGPVPMGPMVYVDAGKQMPTVICRCMPSQVKAIAGNDFYELVPAQDYPGVRIAPGEDTLYLPRAWFDACSPARALAKPRFFDDALNLPEGF